MKKILGILIALMLTVMAFAASAETVITVTGTGETRVAADMAVVTLGVSERDPDAVTAQQKVNARIEAIRNALTELGIEEENITTNYVNIYAIYNYGGEQEQLTGYSASTSLSIRVTDIEFAGKVIDTAFTAGANTLDGVSFSASHTEDARAEAMKKAVADARKKAEILAEASGLKITGIASVSEGGSYSHSNTVAGYGAYDVDEAKSGAPTVLQAAKIIVADTVTVVYTAEQAE